MDKEQLLIKMINILKDDVLDLNLAWEEADYDRVKPILSIMKRDIEDSISHWQKLI